jgi:hypothetical protein
MRRFSKHESRRFFEYQSELDRARAHLLMCQKALAYSREHFGGRLMHIWPENTFLAALSWVWEEQKAAEQVWRNVSDQRERFVMRSEPRGRSYDDIDSWE